MSTIPVIDFAGVFTSSDLASCPQLEQLHAAFSTIGFVFIKNHGIAEKEQIDEAYAATLKFFMLPLEKKKKYLHNRSREGDPGNDGYICYKQEVLDPEKPGGDLKEAFDICTYKNCGECFETLLSNTGQGNINSCYPDEEVPEFRTSITTLFEGCTALANKLLEMIGHALKLEDPMFFVNAHQKQGLGHAESFTALRANYYPPLVGEVKENQVRCGEHVDYGSITLLFHDPNGGLQVKRRDGGYIDVPYIPEAVLVNLGNTMQHLTGDIYIASPHRVLVPKDKESREAPRQSLAYFAHADNDVILKPINDCNKYPPISAREDSDKRMLAAIRTLPDEK